jgi:general secretion pathway protein E
MAEIIETNWFRPMRDDLTQFLREEMNMKGGATEPHNTEAWANALLRDALNSRASDIHLAPQSDGVQLRLRVDGTLFDTLRLTTAQGDRMIRHLKTMADIGPVATFKPQVARRSYQVDGRDVDLRLACVPSICGDTLTIRILESDRLEQRIDQLGLSDEGSAQIATWLRAVTGMFLVTGPTGSGKTTTLYALLHELKVLERSVVTIEDPIEYQLDGVTQVQIDPEHGLTFAEGVKGLLRQDADYMLVGEIRDATSAQAAMEASATGRALMSTLHSRDAVGAVTALRNWDLLDHEIATSLQVVVAQRLVRTLCPGCRRLAPPTEDETHWLTSLGLPVPAQTWHAGHCESCRGLGYRGRTGVFEVLRLGEEDYHLILEHTEERAIRENLAHRGYRPLLADGLSKVVNGLTSMDELRMLGSFYVPPPKTRAVDNLIGNVALLGFR